LARRFRFYEKKRGERRTGSGKAGSMGEGLFYLALLMGGFVSLTMIFVTWVFPVWQSNWRYDEHTCVVLDNRIEVDTQRNEVYRAVQVEYIVHGKTYRPWVYDAHGVYAGSRQEAERDLKRFAVGAEVPCWYDPQNPGTAVVVLDSSLVGWLLLMVPLAFVVLGSSGLFFNILRWGKSVERQAMIGRHLSELDLFEPVSDQRRAYPGVPVEEDVSNSPGTTLAYRLPSGSSPVWKLSGHLLACASWALGASVLFSYTFGAHLEGRPNWWLSGFGVLFALVGIWMSYQFVRHLLITTRAGRTLVEISTHPLRLGNQFEVFVSQSGRLRFRWLRVTLVCQEVAVYRMGTDTRTEVCRVAAHELMRRDRFETGPRTAFEQLQTATVPSAAMHSFKAGHNAIEWKIVVDGRIARWPDFRREFPVLMYPAEELGGRS